MGANHPAFLETLFATAKLGAILAPVNHRLEPAEIRSVVADAAPRVVVLDSSPAATSIPSYGPARVLVAGRASDAISFEDLIASSTDAALEVPVSLSDLCMVPHTSGTEGRPKGVMLTHGNVTWNAVNVITSTDLRPDDITIAIAPFFRVGGTGVNVLPVVLRGGTVIIPRTAPDPEDLLSLMSRHRVSVGFANPDLLEALTRARSWPTCDLTCLRYVITGGAPVPERLLKAFLDRGVPCVQGYGLSEAAPVVALLPPDHALRKQGSAGIPVTLVDVRVVRQDGTLCAPGETGELLVTGPNVMAGYWQLPDQTARTLDSQGWLHTGDAARLDAEGFIWIIDRMADAYDTTGGRVFPSDIDRVLLEHPAVLDAASRGAPAGTGLSQTQSFVVLAEWGTVSETDLIDFCRTRLPPHAVPSSIRFIQSVPRNSVGKVLRRRLEP